MHRSCVDQWLTTVSGRCPVCQKAVIPGEDEAEGEEVMPQHEQGRGEREEAQPAATPAMVETQQPGDGEGARSGATETGRTITQAQESHELQPLSSSVTATPNNPPS